MKSTIRCLILCIGLLAITAQAEQACHSMLNFEAKKLRSSDSIDFCQRFAGKTMLVVNTASQCGYTGQFAGLEKLHQTYGDDLAVVGFPSNDFKQEFSESKKVADVCYLNYGVTFTMLEASSVTGEQANALFKQLSERTGQPPTWNFNKYLLSADGETVKHFPANVEPMSKALRSEIETVLAAD